MTPEGRIKAKLNRALKALGPSVWRFMPVQNGMGAPGLDYFLCVNGHFLAIETKAPGKKLTPRQETTAANIVAAGGTVLLVRDEQSLHEAIIVLMSLYDGGEPE